MPFRPNSSLFRKNSTRNINYMTPLIFSKCHDFNQVSANSAMSILGQSPSGTIADMSGFRVNLKHFSGKNRPSL